MGIDLGKIADIDMTSGNLGDTHLALLLGIAGIWDVTGVLTLERDKTQKKIFFLEGLPVYCKSDLSSESLRQVLCKNGQIDHKMLARVQNLMEKEGVEEDRALLELGVLNESTRYFHLQDQARKRILSCFEWASGSYKFEAKEDFLDRIDLFDIDPLEVVYEGMTNQHFIEVANVMQKVSSEAVSLSGNIGDMAPFMERHFPESIPSWNDLDGKILGNILPKLNPDISKALDLSFILVAMGGLLLNGTVPGELHPPASIDESDGENTAIFGGDSTVSDESQEDDDNIFPSDPWAGDVESPSLEDDDGDVPMEPSRPVEKPRSEKAGPSTKKPVPPALPPWKKRQLEYREQLKRKAAMIKSRPSRKTPATSRAGAAATRQSNEKQSERLSNGKAKDPNLEKRFLRMLEVVRGADPFEILDVDEKAQRSDIKKAYFYRHDQFHPDKKNALGPDGESVVEEVQKGLRDAYDILLDPAKRHEYYLRIFEDEKKKAWSIDLRRQLAKKQFDRGVWFMSQRRPELALNFFDSAVNLDTEQAAYYAFLGWSQYTARRGDAAASMAFIRTGLGINSKLSEGYLFLGWIQKDIGDESKATECFELAVEYNPQNKFATQELEKSGMTDKKTGGEGLLKKLFKK